MDAEKTILHGGITTRHKDLLDVNLLRDIPIHFIGCGAINSFAALTLGKMGAWNLHLWDHDIVGIENIGNQIFPTDSIGKPKVEVAGKLINELTGAITTAHNMKWDGQILEGIVIVGVDNMTTRKKVWEHVNNNLDVSYFIDARMGAQELRCVSLLTSDINCDKIYNESWYPDSEAMPDKCTAKTIIYTVLVAAAEIAKRVRSYINKEPFPRHTATDIRTMVTIPILE